MITTVKHNLNEFEINKYETNKFLMPNLHQTFINANKRCEDDSIFLSLLVKRQTLAVISK